MLLTAIPIDVSVVVPYIFVHETAPLVYSTTTSGQRVPRRGTCEDETSSWFTRLANNTSYPSQPGAVFRNYANNLSDIMSDFSVLISQSNNAWEP